ncbi:MAG: hypothetical protein V3U88_03140 [Methylococcales bacterium]
MVSKPIQYIAPKSVECVITCFDDGDMSVKDTLGNEIRGVPEQDFFVSCECKEITEIQESIIDIKIIERDGTHCNVKKIGNMIYKIVCEV